jgi:hypothetical protein
MAAIACATCGEPLICEDCEVSDLSALTDQEIETLEQLVWTMQASSEQRDRFEIFLSHLVPYVTGEQLCARCGGRLVCVHCSGAGGELDRLSPEEQAALMRLLEKARRAS